jgi:hypothetical protein
MHTRAGGDHGVFTIHAASSAALALSGSRVISASACNSPIATEARERSSEFTDITIPIGHHEGASVAVRR